MSFAENQNGLAPTADNGAFVDNVSSTAQTTTTTTTTTLPTSDVQTSAVQNTTTVSTTNSTPNTVIPGSATTSSTTVTTESSTIPIIVVSPETSLTRTTTSSSSSTTTATATTKLQVPAANCNLKDMFKKTEKEEKLCEDKEYAKCRLNNLDRKLNLTFGKKSHSTALQHLFSAIVYILLTFIFYILCDIMAYTIMV